jgi:hypothetical protein
MPAPVTGLFIIRAWIEQGSTEPLRAHIRLTTDISGGFEDSMTLSEVRAVCEAVATWLGNVLSGPAGSSTSRGVQESGEAMSRQRHAAATRGRSR